MDVNSLAEMVLNFIIARLKLFPVRKDSPAKRTSVTFLLESPPQFSKSHDFFVLVRWIIRLDRTVVTAQDLS